MEATIELRSPDEALALFGSQDRHLRMLKERFDVTIIARNGLVKLIGDEAAVHGAEDALRRVLARVRKADGGELTAEEVAGLLGPGHAGIPTSVAEAVRIGSHVEGYRARTPGQQRYLDLLEKNEIVFGIGPAGSGKTFLAVLKAVEKLKSAEVHKIVLCRPVVEAGERLGFLPGDFMAKVNPYLRPLYDALNEILDADTVKKLIERETIEIVPLAYMRGRTLNRSFIILDEAQNTTREQMKMFLTRMGEGSRIVVTGDITQVDLPEGKASGLVHIQRILRPVEGIAFHHMTGKDIVRHKLVWHVVQSYERAEKEEAHPHRPVAPPAGGGAGS
ncbi:MAG TPA: PhoH family protein [Planctomycetota bacterium]|nr:PhoH family protein [Planctomycetota bacterium]